MRGDRNDGDESEQSSENERSRERLFSGSGKEETAGKNTGGKFGQADDRIEAENVFPEERCLTGINFVETVRMKIKIANRKNEAEQTRSAETNRELCF